MKNLTEKQKNKLIKVAKVASHGMPAIVEHLLEIENRLDEELPNTLKILSNIRGEDGKDGAKGDDGKEGAKGDRGEKGDKGEDGRDGRDGVNGRDGTDGNDGRDGEDGRDGQNGRDGSPDTAQNIADKLNSTNESVDSSVIKGLEKFKKDITSNLAHSNNSNFNPRLWQGVDKIIAGRNITITSSKGNGKGDVVISSTASGGGGSAGPWQEVTGTIDGINTVFMTSGQVTYPNEVNIDGSVYPVFTGLWNWDSGTMELTVTDPNIVPTQFIYYR